uniref:Helicase domino n=1 Tax=Strigamia maritima TaxID=126957 RepID=T1JC71_STRMM
MIRGNEAEASNSPQTPHHPAPQIEVSSEEVDPQHRNINTTSGQTSDMVAVTHKNPSTPDASTSNYTETSDVSSSTVTCNVPTTETILSLLDTQSVSTSHLTSSSSSSFQVPHTRSELLIACSDPIQLHSYTAPAKGQHSQSGQQLRHTSTSIDTVTVKTKRIKLDAKPPDSEEIGQLRKMICAEWQSQLGSFKKKYENEVTELFFLENGGNMMDFTAWMKRPTLQLVAYLKNNCLQSDNDDEEEEEEEEVVVTEVEEMKKVVEQVRTAETSEVDSKGTSPLAVPSVSIQPVCEKNSSPAVICETQAIILKDEPDLPDINKTPTCRSLASSPPLRPGLFNTFSPVAGSGMSEPKSPSPVSPLPSTAVPITSTPKPSSIVLPNTSTAAAATTTNTASSPKSHRLPISSMSPVRLQTRQHSISAVYDSSIGSQEEIVERAKQEAYVVQRTAELRKEGLWSEKRLPKVQEPPRSKAHWDYLLEEMVWLASDFAQERKWKKAVAKKFARLCQKFHQEQKLREERAEKEAEQKLKRVAAVVAKEIKQFWSNVEKLVEYKQQSRLEEKRKKALDLHLNFIVDQTEKYSSWLARGMNKNLLESSNTSLVSSARESRTSSPTKSSSDADYDFEPTTNQSTDDEETIAIEEEHEKNPEEEEMELKMLQEESEVPLDDLLESLPAGILDRAASPLPSDGSGSDGNDTEAVDDEFAGDDDEFKASRRTSSDDEATLDEQEQREKNMDHEQELEELKMEGEMNLEDLMEKYSGPQAEDSQTDEDDEERDESTDDDKEDVGIESLVSEEPTATTGETKKEIVGKRSEPTKEIADIAADAESLQPKGYTYSTAQVATKVPFLLKHQLREYQHIGLDWLVTMQDRNLNGILADEMGLGKTIQTIALLAQLACEKGTWGPHLIVVPTSVMLNWEMEFKKWCPAFKILTYYGTQKERKQKRQGWTKPNAFHVCITSYKLVIQDHQSFRRKRWKYFILDEAQNIKNFKSQRWQLLLNFQSQRRLLLTGTPLQNSLMELWSLMHFLMPNVFQSHRDFKEWFSNPLSGMIEGSHEYNESLIKRLHKVLRPFLLRRLKSEVEKQLPRKFEHVVMCRLSKRQRFLYDDFMSQTKTKETLATGNFMSVINILMQLRKVCNHPNMFEERPIISPFQMEGIKFWTASIVYSALEYDPFKHVDLYSLNLLLADLELYLTAFAAHRIKRFQTPKKLIEEIDSAPGVPPKCPPGKIKLHVRTSTTTTTPTQSQRDGASTVTAVQQRVSSPSVVRTTTINATTTTSIAHVAGTQVKTILNSPSGVSVTASATPQINKQVSGYTFQLVPQQPHGGQSSVAAPLTPVVTTAPITVQIQQTQQGPRIVTVPGPLAAQFSAGFAQIVQTSTGQHILLTSNPQAIIQSINTTTASGVTLSSVKNVTSVATVTAAGTVAANQPKINVITNKPVTLNVTAAKTTPLNLFTARTVTPVNVAPTTTVNSVGSSNSKAIVNISPTKPTTRADSLKEENAEQLQLEETKSRSLFYMEDLNEKRARHRANKLSLLAKFNTRRCEACPIYGSDLVKALTVVEEVTVKQRPTNMWSEMGYVHCLNAVNPRPRPNFYWNQTSALCDTVWTPEKCLGHLKEVSDRFVFRIPAVMAPRIQMHVSHPPPSRFQKEWCRDLMLQHSLSSQTDILHRISSDMTTHFPDPRLIQYDCGKLQTLDYLLRRLKTESHRVLIFTQMTRMLDILEQFLNYHGYIYLRLDGTTRVEQRQALMERFNADKRIFVFILSTRSGGIGVNLTGADTVIFYDSDWNPTMDAQAQDRCHRIGQTRDVHIYRLVSRMTVEENILKKANQKRLLGEVAIEGGNFTTAFFRSNTIKELFDFNFEEALELKPIKKEEIVAPAPSQNDDNLTTAQLEHALANAEEDMDVQATKTAKAEAAAELAEFDESIPYDGDSRLEDETSKVEEELGALTSQLTPVERYAMKFLESIQEPFSLEQLKQAEEEIEAQKKDWELGRLQALKEEEQRRALMEDDDVPFTYNREDANNQVPKSKKHQDSTNIRKPAVYLSQNGQEQMMIWAPPTPPQDENDVYIDYCMCFLYEPSVMPESQLPPIYVKKEHKRLRVDANISGRRQKIRKDEAVCVPRSLFDRPTAAVLKMRRDLKMQKLRGMSRMQIPAHKPPQAASKPSPEVQIENCDWLIQEDWALLQAVQALLELPLSLTVLSPAHTPNWDMVADVVNSTSHYYRSPKQCKNRYELVIVPREEGKILYDTNPKKQKKSKGIYRTKNNRPMRTSQLYLNDNNNTFATLHHGHFETIKNVANKRTPTLKPMLVPTMKKHAAVLADSNISYDNPLSPAQVAAIRAERIARDKQKTQAAAVVRGTSVVEQQLAAQRQQQQQQQVLAQVAVNQQAVVAAQQLQSMINVGSTPLAQRNATSGISVRNLANTGQPMVSLTAAQVHAAAQRISAANLASATAVTGAGVVPIQTGTKNLTVQQLNVLRAQAAQQQTLMKQQRLQRLQQQQGVVSSSVAAQAQKVSVAVTSPGVAALHMSQAQQRAQMVKQGMKTGRPMTEADLAQLMKQRQQQQQKVAATGAQVAQIQVPSQGGQVAQILTHSQLQQIHPAQPPVATLVKTVSAPTAMSSTASVTIPMSSVSLTLPNVKTTSAPTLSTTNQQSQLRQFQQQLLQRKLQQQQEQNQKAQLAKASQLGAVQIMQPCPTAQKQLPAATMRQVIKQVTAAAASIATQSSSHQVLSHTMLTKPTQSATPPITAATGQTVQTRVIPICQSVAPVVTASISSPIATHTPLKQIQVVTAASPTFTQAGIRSQGPPGTISLDTIARSQTILSAPTVVTSGSTTPVVKLTTAQAAILTQVPATAMQASGHPITVAVRTTNPLQGQLTTTVAAAPAVMVAAPVTVAVTSGTSAGVVQTVAQTRTATPQRTNYTMRLRNLPKQVNSHFKFGPKILDLYASFLSVYPDVDSAVSFVLFLRQSGHRCLDMSDCWIVMGIAIVSWR